MVFLIQKHAKPRHAGSPGQALGVDPGAQTKRKIASPKPKDLTDEELGKAARGVAPARAEQTLGTLNSRRAARQKKAS